MENVKQKNMKYIVNSTVGIMIMFVFWIIPPIAPVTSYGMQLLGVLAGCVYLWSTVGLIWPSALGVIAMALSENGGVQIITTAFSNSNVLLLLFIFPVFSVITNTGVFNKLTIYILSSKLVSGKPYLFAFVMLALVALLSPFANGPVVILIFWSIITGMAKTLGVDAENKFVKCMIVGIPFASMMGFVCVPFVGFGLILNGLFTSYTGIVFDPILYMGIMFSMTTVAILLYLAVMKFIIRVDVTAFKSVNANALQKGTDEVAFTKDQKILLTYLIVFMVFLCMPNLLPATLGVTIILKKLDAVGICLIAFIILCILRDAQGKPYLDMRTASKDIGWDMVFLFACAIQLSGSLSGDGTGIATLMSSSLGAVLGAHNEFVIILVLAVVSLILTNFANNWVVLMLMISALALSAQSLTVNISLAFIMIVFCGNIGFVLPSASIYGAMLHGNESVSPKDIYQYTSICIVITIITVCIFIPIGGMFIK